MITIGTIKPLILLDRYPVVKSTVDSNENAFQLDRKLDIKLTNGLEFTIPQGYVWEKLTIPKILKLIWPNNPYLELAFLIYETLFKRRKELGVTKEFAEEELHKWLYTIIDASGSLIKKVSIKIWLWFVTKDRKKEWDND